jgi:hypothetical protein
MIKTASPHVDITDAAEDQDYDSDPSSDDDYVSVQLESAEVSENAKLLRCARRNPTKKYVRILLSLHLNDADDRVTIYVISNNSDVVKWRRRATQGPVKRNRISMSHLPAELRIAFCTRFAPFLRDLAGTIEPWQHPCKEDLHPLLLAAFPDQKLEVDSELTYILGRLVRISHHLSSGSPTHDLLETDDRLADWRNKFASTAMKYLENIFLQQDLNTPVKRADYVKRMLGDNNRNCPFYYKKFKEGTTPIVNFACIPVCSSLLTALHRASFNLQ